MCGHLLLCCAADVAKARDFDRDRICRPRGKARIRQLSDQNSHCFLCLICRNLVSFLWMKASAWCLKPKKPLAFGLKPPAFPKWKTEVSYDLPTNVTERVRVQTKGICGFHLSSFEMPLEVFVSLREVSKDYFCNHRNHQWRNWHSDLPRRHLPTLQLN